MLWDDNDMQTRSISIYTRNATQGYRGDYMVVRGNKWQSDSLSANQEAEDSKLEDWWGL